MNGFCEEMYNCIREKQKKSTVKQKTDKTTGDKKEKDEKDEDEDILFGIFTFLFSTGSFCWAVWYYLGTK